MSEVTMTDIETVWEALTAARNTLERARVGEMLAGEHDSTDQELDKAYGYLTRLKQEREALLRAVEVYRVALERVVNVTAPEHDEGTHYGPPDTCETCIAREALGALDG